MKIGFLCAHDPRDRTSFSGTAYHAFKALEALAEAGIVSDLRLLGWRSGGLVGSDRFSALFRTVSGSARVRQAKLEDGCDFGLDWIVSLASTELAVSALPRLHTRLAHITDATPQFLREQYGWNLPASVDRAERKLVLAADAIVYSSEFMADRVCTDFGVDISGKVRAIPFGVNLDHVPDAPRHPDASPSLGDPLQLLFIGGDWERKGGPLALEILMVLLAKGIPARLTIVGSDPVAAVGIPQVTVHPFLNKNSPAGSAQFDALLDAAHLLLLPTRADCTPMVVAEANAHSVPALVTNVGGISSILSNDRNGLLMSPSASADDWVAAIQNMIADQECYKRRREASFAFFRERLNWKVWAHDLVKFLASLEAQP